LIPSQEKCEIFFPSIHKIILLKLSLRNNYWLILFWTPINPRKTLPLKTETFNAGHNEIMSWAVHLCRKWNEERIVIHAGFYLRRIRPFRSNISVEDVKYKVSCSTVSLWREWSEPINYRTPELELGRKCIIRFSRKRKFNEN
jgi:hypothetical protein